MVSQDKWSLETGGLMRKVVYKFRWSFKRGCILKDRQSPRLFQIYKNNVLYKNKVKATAHHMAYNRVSNL